MLGVVSSQVALPNAVALVVDGRDLKALGIAPGNIHVVFVHCRGGGCEGVELVQPPVGGLEFK